MYTYTIILTRITTLIEQTQQLLWVCVLGQFELSLQQKPHEINHSLYFLCFYSDSILLVHCVQCCVVCLSCKFSVCFYEVHMAKCMQTEECNMVIKLAQHIKGPGILQNQSQITIHNGKSQYNKDLAAWAMVLAEQCSAKKHHITLNPLSH